MLNAKDRAFFVFLAVLAAYIWWRDQAWMATAGEVLPILAAFPLFWWCGRPWRWRSGGGRLEWRWVTMAAAVWMGGEVLNATALLALAWALALWSLLAARLAPESLTPVARLLPLPWLAFPWLALEAERIGWWFRLSAAGVAERLFGALGLDVARQGTQVLVQGLPISVDADCSGLKVLQAMLIAGLVVVHRQYGSSRQYWWSLPALVAAAWCANTFRVLLVSVVALSAGPDFASGWFHAWGGMVALALMFAVCLAGVSMVHRCAGVMGRTYPAWRHQWAGLAALFFCALMVGDLPRAWLWSPFDRAGSVAFVGWALPVMAALVLQHKAARRGLLVVPSVLFSASALVLLMMGAATSLNVFKHGAVVFAAAAFMPRSWKTGLWLVSAASWMPALGWVFHGAGLAWVHLARVALGAGALAMGLLSLRRAPEGESRLEPGKDWWRLWALGVAVAVTLLWEMVPLSDATQRLKLLPREGLGYSSVDVALSRVEKDVYREAQVVKRLYCTASDRVVIVVVDGTRNRHAVHDPGYCFRGGGWRVRAEERQPLPGGAAMRVFLERGADRTEAVYWFTDGVTRHASALRYWAQTSLRRLTLGVWGEEPILVVMQPAPDSPGAVDWGLWLDQVPDFLTL